MTRILVIEDDKPLRDWIEQVLARKGYAVDLCENGAEGLLKLGSAEYDLLILDLLMPQMSGFEVLSALEEKKIRVPTVITSGIVIPGVHDYLKTHPQVQLVSKPYTDVMILETIHALLDSARKPKKG